MFIPEPPKKVPKRNGFTEDYDVSTSFSISSTSIEPVLHESFLVEESPLVDFHVVRFANKRNIGEVLKIVPELPEKFLHLKRVDTSGRVLIQPTYEDLDDQFLRILGQLEDDSLIVERVPVPLMKPKTRKQADWARKYWPTAFHPQKKVEELIDGTYFKNRDVEYVANWARKAFDIGCLVVQKGELLAEGSSSERLLAHPVIELMSNLAKMQRKGTEYLATGCDVFLAVEPCAMCAMALVHARAERVFFVRKSINGVLSKGTWQLHLIPQFNHHYNVFHVKVEPTEEVVCR